MTPCGFRVHYVRSMRQLMFVKSGMLRWQDAVEPTLQCATDALVRPFIAARCDGDSLYLRHNLRKVLAAGARLHVIDGEFRCTEHDPFVGPCAYCHECVAEVLRCGLRRPKLLAGRSAVTFRAGKSPLPGQLG